MSVPRTIPSPHPLYALLLRCLLALRRCVPNLACLLCKQLSSTAVCTWCEQDVAFFSQDPLPDNLLLRPAIASHVRHAHYHGLYACGGYQWPFSTLIQALKFHRQPVAAAVLARWFTTHALSQRDRPLPDCLLPIPLHFWRLSQRLYNQAGELALEIGQRLSLPVCHHWAVRHKGGTQHTRNRHARLQAARQSYRLTEKPLDRWLCHHQVRSVALVDDVLTTGITVDVLAAQLRQRYPTLHIEVWVMAVTPAPGQRRR